MYHIYKLISNKSKKCLSISNSGILSIVCVLLPADTLANVEVCTEGQNIKGQKLKRLENKAENLKSNFHENSKDRTVLEAKFIWALQK